MAMSQQHFGFDGVFVPLEVGPVWGATAHEGDVEA